MDIERIVREIKAGNLVITPTDTVYGILTDALNASAVEKVYQAKKRSYNKPLLLLVSDLKMLEDYSAGLTRLERELVQKYMPGPLTMLLPRDGRIPDEVVNGGLRVGMRIPDQEQLQEVIAKVGHPLVSTSANISEQTTATRLDELEPELLEKIAYMEDAGEIKAKPSTIVAVENGKIRILREGEVGERIKREYKALCI